ncbi:ecdysone-induced protein 74EF-like, partial [Cynara cardunculus var. scolymus]
ATTTTATNYFHSIESNTDSWGEDSSQYQSNYGSSASAAGSVKIRLMCSSGGHIVPRPHDKSLCYVGGETHMVVVDRHTTLVDLTHRLSKTILRSSSSSTAGGFTLKYQLPTEDLDSLISVTTDEDLENMIEEYERLNSSSAVSKSSRLRLFIFPAKPESVSSIGSFLENSTKSEDWFLNALNGTTSGFSDTSSVNNLLGLDDEISLPEKKEVNQKGLLTTNLIGNNSGQDVHSIPDSPMMETTSSFGSASSTPSQPNLPPVSGNVDDHPKVGGGGGIEEMFSQMSVQQRHHKDQDDGVLAAAPAPVAVSGSPMSSATAIPEHSDPFLSYHERSEQGLQMAYLKHQQQQQQQQQFQQKQSTGSILSDMPYQEPVVQIQSSSNNNRVVDPNDTPDQSPRIQMQQQQQQNQNSAYLMSMPTTKADAQHPQLHHQQQLQFIHNPVPQPQYFHHHPPAVVPVASYYQMYQSPAMDQQNFVYYMPTRQQPPQGYNFPLQQQHADSSPRAPTNQAAPPPTTTRTPQAAPKTELPVGVYRATNSGGQQLIQVASGHQHQPQYVGFRHPTQSVASPAAGGGGGGGGGNFGYEFTDSLQQGQLMYYATQPMPPQSAAQYQTTSPIEASSQQSSNNR